MIFEEWKSVMNHPGAKFTPERRRKVRARLVEYTAERIITAIYGCKKSPHHQGHNDTGTVYDDLTLICRSGSDLERFEAMAPARRKNGSPSPGLKKDEEIMAELDKEFEATNGRV